MGTGREDVDTGGGEFRLQPGVAVPRALAGELGELVRGVDGTDGQRGIRGTGTADAARTAVTGRYHEQRTGLGAESVDRLAHRVGRVAATAQAHADDLGLCVPGSPFHARDDPGLLSPTLAVENLADLQPGPGRDTPLLRVGGAAGSGDRRGDVGAVAVEVGDAFLVRNEAGAGVNLSDEVRVFGVHPGVEDSDLHALGGVALRPDLLRADLCGGLGQVGFHLAVEPDFGDAARQSWACRSVACLCCRGIAGERGPELRGLVALLRDRRALHAVKLADDGRTGHVRRGPRLGGGVGVADDERQPFGVRVVVPVGDQPGHVEQLLVQQPRADIGQGRIGIDVRRTVDDGAVEAGGGSGRALDGPDDGAVGGGADRDLVTGDQGDAVAAAAYGWLRRGADGRYRVGRVRGCRGDGWYDPDCQCGDHAERDRRKPGVGNNGQGDP